MEFLSPSVPFHSMVLYTPAILHECTRACMRLLSDSLSVLCAACNNSSATSISREENDDFFFFEENDD